MKKLESELAYYKMVINSNYGFGNASELISNAYQLKLNQFRRNQLRRRIITIKMRKNKIKKIFNI
jgi:hypothetical protein